MKPNPNLTDYNQTDVEALYLSGSIVPNVDEHSNLIIQNSPDQLFLSSITILLGNVLYNPVKVETKLDPTFYEL